MYITLNQIAPLIANAGNFNEQTVISDTYIAAPYDSPTIAPTVSNVPNQTFTSTNALNPGVATTLSNSKDPATSSAWLIFGFLALLFFME